MANPKPKNSFDIMPPQYNSKDRILVVCEGEITEPNYFQGLANFYKLNNVKIVGKGATPMAVVNEASCLNSTEKKEYGDKYDQVYCVFDRDEHHDYNQAKIKAEKMGFITIYSWPCFEFWILLHFKYTRKPYTSSSGRTPAQNCIKSLKDSFSEYKKNKKNLFNELDNRLNYAKSNSIQALKDAEETNEFNPSTKVHILVEELQSQNY